MMAISLATIARTRHATPPRIVIYGPEKCGKSSFFAGCVVHGVIHEPAPKPIFIRTEDGLNGLDVDAFPIAEHYSQVIEAITALAQEDHDYQTVVLDSADWLERLIHQAVIQSCPLDIRGAKTMETAHGGYGKAYGLAMNYWREILMGLDYLNKQKAMTIGIICHSQVVTFNDPLAEPYDKWETKLHKPNKGTGARDLLNEWADVIGFAQREGFVRRQDTTDGKQVARGIAAKGVSNKLNLVGTPGFIAGNRYGLPDTIPLSWSAFAAAMTKAQTPAMASINPPNTTQPA